MPPKKFTCVQSIPHAGLEVPAEVASRLALDDVAIYNECDLWADQLFDFTHPDLNQTHRHAPTSGCLAVVKSPIARVLIDVNRPPDALDDPDGPIKTLTSYGAEVYAELPSLSERTALRDRYWSPYHQHLSAALSGASEVRLLLDCHNMAQTGPSHYAYAGQPRPLICLANLGDRDGEPVSGSATTCPGWLLREAGEIAHELFADMTLLEPVGEPPDVVALNYPFAGGYINRRYSHANPDVADAAPRAPLAIMIEVNRGLFVGNQSPHSPILPPNQARIATIRERLYRWVLALGIRIEEAGT